MAPVKPMGTNSGVGFPQAYNQEPPKPTDLNPDAVTDGSVLPKPAVVRTAKAPKAPRVAKAPKPAKIKK